MATFSLGNSAAIPEAPGVYINERPGALGVTDIAPFSTVYMLVETEEDVPVIVFPFNTPVPITSLNEYKALIAVGTKLVPTERIPLLSYNCVNEFFQNAQVGDLRVVRVGSPNQIVEIELLPTGQKVNNSDLPSNLQAGNKVYIQMEINGIPVVSGNGTTGFDANGEYLGVPVIIPVDYIPGDDVNNRKISAAMATALSTAIETNPAVSSSVYVRSAGLVNDLPGQSSTNQNGYVTIAASTFNGDVNVITGVNPIGNQFVFTQGTYDIQNIVGQSASLVRTPQDYTQCIQTAFDGQQDQGYLITPTAYAQFNALGRAQVGASAAALAENNNYKWMALADPGPYLVTDINEYNEFSPHEAAEDLVQGAKYLINNVIYEWTGADVSYDRANHQTIQSGSSAQTAVTESVTVVGANQNIGLLDKGVYDAQSQLLGKILLSNNNWPVVYEIQSVTLSGATASTNPFFPYNGKEVFVVAPPKNIALTGDYPLNVVYLAETAAAAQNILSEVVAKGGSDFQTTVPVGAIAVVAGAACVLTYASPQWDLEVNINGQVSNLVENITDSPVTFNTLHLPGTLQTPTAEYRLGFESRTIFNPAVSITLYSGSVATLSGAAVIEAKGHGLTNSQKLYFTQPVVSTALVPVTVFKATSRISQVPYYVTVLTPDTFVLSASLTAFSAQSYVPFPGAALATKPTIFYTALLGGTATSTSLTELSIIPAVRGRKYGFASGTIDNQAAAAAVAPAPAATNPGVSIWLNNSTQVLGDEQVVAWGETVGASWLPKLELVDPGDISDLVGNFLCVPTVAQSFTSQNYLVPSIDAILGGSYDPSAPSTTGPVATLGVSAGGTGGAAGTYNAVTTTGGTGTGATLNVVKVASTTGPINTLGASVPGTGSIASATGTYTNSYNGVALNGGTGTAATGNVLVSQTAVVGPIAALGAPVAGAGTVNVAAAVYTNTYNGVALVGGSGSAATANVTVTQTAGVGPLVVGAPSVGVITPGTGGTPGTYTGVALTNVTGTGTAATADIVVGAGGDVTGVTIVALGSGYANGNSLSALSANIGGVTGFSFLVAQVTLPVAVSAVALAAAGSGYAPAVALTIAAGDIGGVTGAGVALNTVTIPIAVATVTLVGAGSGYTAGNALTILAGDIGGITGAGVPVATITPSFSVSSVALAAPGVGYTAADTLTVTAAQLGGGVNLTVPVATITASAAGAVSGVTPYATAVGIANGTDGDMVQALLPQLTGVYFDVTANGTAPDDTTAVVAGDRIVAVSNGTTYDWQVVAAASLGGDLTAYGQVCYGSSAEISYTEQQVPPSNLWLFDAITSEEIISDALRGVGFNGVPQAVQLETGVDNVSRLLADSKLYGNAFGFIAYYGPYIENGAGQWIPPSPYVSGVALRRYRAQGYQFPPAGTKFQLVDAFAVEIPINSQQQNLLNPEGCNAIRTLPGYPQNAIYIWGGRTRLTNPDDAQQKLYQFVNTRVILNVVYGSLRNAFDSQIFNVIDGFGVVFNQIVNVGNSVLNELYARGALFGAKPSDAFQVICDERINRPNNLENGIVEAKVFVTPVPTLERIQIDLIRVAIGQMQNELNAQGLGQNNSL
jgi:hypothetical protein